MKVLFQIMFIILSLFQSVHSIEFERVFPEITGDVKEINQGALTNLGEYGYFFVMPDSGLVYYDIDGNLKSFSTPEEYGGLPIVSAACLGNSYITDKILFATGIGHGSESDALYEFNTISQEFTMHSWTGGPNFIKYQNSGFYFGTEWGLLYSIDGISWDNDIYFTNYDVKGIVEISDGRQFVSVLKSSSIAEVVMKNGEDYSNIGIPIGSGFNCVYHRKSGDYEEVLVTIGVGLSADGLYRVIYNDTAITNVELIKNYNYADQVFSFSDYYLVTKKGSSNIIAIPHSGGASMNIEHGLDISKINCFQAQYPIYTPNFLIGTDKGVYMATGTVGIENTTIPFTTELHQNYPNPFNPQTEISYSLKSEGQVTLSVFNIKGELVDQLVNEKKAAGNHTVNFNGEGLNSGIYFYKLEVNGIVTGSKRMLLLK